MTSLAAELAALDEADRERVLGQLGPARAAALRYDWRFWARPEQMAPGTPGAALARTDWRTWLVLAGRGFGKTRMGAEWVRERVQGGARHLIIAGPTAADVRDVMIEGESGILAIYPPGEAPLYEPSKRRLTWPNGATAVLLSAEEPERFRGIQGDTAWCDELAAWSAGDAWELLQFSMRLGEPRFMVTTTPKPTPTVKALLRDPRTVVTRGSTFDNAQNLAPDFIAAVRDKYEGTRLGRQELYAEILDDVPGALWQPQRLDQLRVRHAPDLIRVVVAIDPAVTSSTQSDETGIVVAGVGDCDCKVRAGGQIERHGFVLADLSGQHTPDAWARAALEALRTHGADRIVAEVNNGGDLVEVNLRTVDRNAPYTAVRASRGKRTRAEPVAALYEQGKVHHVGGLPKLEDQLCTWDPFGRSGSPDRLDALVWALSELMLTAEETIAEILMRGGFGAGPVG